MNKIGKPLNVIWMLIDSVRNYRGGGDDRDKLHIMDVLAKESAEFKNVVTSAPSTIMSVTAMMTSWPSYYIARNYDDFKYDNGAFHSLTDILRERGYKDHSIIFFREGREKLRNLFNLVGHKYWPRGLSHAKKYWTNDDINEVLFRFLEKGINDPFFLYLHYNCRWDPNTSDKVTLAIERLKQAGLYENSLFVVCSDHGYPDPSRGYTPEGLKRLKLTHDLILSSDNVLVPLYIRYPGVPVCSIDTTISTLDIMPTILKILDIDVPVTPNRPYRLWGYNLLPLLNGEENPGLENRKVRIDSRLLAQDGRVTAIRDNRYSYLIHHDDKREELYDLIDDPSEQNNLLDSDSPMVPNSLNEYRRAFEQSELEAVEFQFQYVLTKFRHQMMKLQKRENFSSGRNILIFGSCHVTYLKLLVRVIDTYFMQCNIDILVENKISIDEEWIKSDNVKIIDNQDKKLAHKFFADRYSQVADKNYSLVITPFADSAAAEYEKILIIARNLKGRLLSIDYNMKINYRYHRKWYFIFKVICAKRKFYFQEPILILIDSANMFKKTVRHFLKRIMKHKS